jgi:SAM-dependent methyltransferase
VSGDDSIGPYEQGFAEFAARYEAVDPAVLHARLTPFLPARPGLALDVGAGTGRDAAWLAGLGWEVWAAEPAPAFRALGERVHPTSSIHWLDDRLPGLELVRRLSLVFDLVWLSAVWMHVAPEDRRSAFRRLTTLLRPSGRLVISLRLGPADPGRAMHPVSLAEVERLALEHGLMIRAVVDQADELGRTAISWQVAVLELPDDGTDALPLLRSVVLEDLKSATYKLALLRVIARAADQSASLAVFEEEAVRVPLGLLALFWIRMFKPLVEQGLPQTPSDGKGRGLGFVKASFRGLRPIAPFELRPGGTFTGADAKAVAGALRDAAYTIARMPAHFTTYPDGRPIFPTEYEGRIEVRGELLLDAPTLRGLGQVRVPVHLWTTLRRLAAWIEPMLVAEWVRLVQRYGERQDRVIEGDHVRNLLGWIDPERDTGMIRNVVSDLFDKSEPIFCVWTGTRLRDVGAVEVDHCFPWSIWPCDDLWNLMPCSRAANQNKRNRLITRDLLYAAADRIQDWWSRAYRKNPSGPLMRRFEIEARTTLTIDDLPRPTEPWGPAEAPLEFGRLVDAMDLQRLRLRRDQQIPEWRGLDR